MKDLTEKKCVPCEGGVAPLTREQFASFLSQLPEWQVVEDKELVCEFVFKDFKEALVFINRVGDLAEKEGHHPDILLYGYKHVKITLSTHAINGLSENDFILAAKINNYYER